MNTTELRAHLDYLVTTYVRDEPKRSELAKLIHASELPPVKGIMADIEANASNVSQKDSDLIKEIAFNYL